MYLGLEILVALEKTKRPEKKLFSKSKLTARAIQHFRSAHGEEAQCVAKDDTSSTAQVSVYIDFLPMSLVQVRVCIDSNDCPTHVIPTHLSPTHALTPRPEILGRSGRLFRR